MDYDYRLVRGLSLQLDRRSVFECVATINPAMMRRKLFQEAAKSGLPTTEEQRVTIVQTVAFDLNLKPKLVEEFFYADLENELVLREFSPIPPQDLLRKYNLSLTQTLLFNATRLTFTTSGRWQQIFRNIKRLGLIYEAYEDNGIHIKVDGPSSLFKQERRYGTSIAKLLPIIVSNPEWTVEAEIHWKYTNEICSFRIESKKHNEFLESSEVSNISYDSVVEADFSKRFQSLKSGWHLQREPEPITSGRYVIIPDFSFEKDGIKIYMEIVGFWTPQYLSRKIKKLERIDVDMLIAVDEALACEKLKRLEKQGKHSLVYYHKKIPMSPILDHLKNAFQELKERQTELLRSLPVTFIEPVVHYKRFAAEVGVSVEAVKAMLKERSPENWIPLEESLVKRDKLEQIRRALTEKACGNVRLPLIEAQNIIEKEQIVDTPGVLKILGYKIIWHGINPEEAEVIKVDSKQAKGLSL